MEKILSSIVVSCAILVMFLGLTVSLANSMHHEPPAILKHGLLFTLFVGGILVFFALPKKKKEVED